MGVEELVDTVVIPINMESEEAVTILKSSMQSFFQQLDALDVPVSWMSLRGSLAQYHSKYIKHDDLEMEAGEYGISADDLKKFCRLFTSFGSILDVQLINSQSKYIIVKPKEFLQELHHVFDRWESPDLTRHGIITATEMSSLKEETKVFLHILCSVGLAARVPHTCTAIFEGTTISDPAFYIPSVRTGNDDVRCKPGAIQLVIGMKSSPVNMHIRIIDYLLCNLENAQLIITQAINTIKITTPESPFEIEITSQGDVIEIFSHGEKWYGEMYRKVCGMIYIACSHVAQTMATTSRDIKYHFAVTCVADRFKEIGYNIYHRRHVLPSDLCEKCNDKRINEGQITIWNIFLKQKPIEQRFKLNGKLDIDEIKPLAEAISSYHPIAIKLFVEELGIDLPNKPRVTNIVGAIINWSDEYEKKNEESAKKVLARKLINLDATWKNERERLSPIADHENAKFKHCARQLDIQVYAESQLRLAGYTHVKDMKQTGDDQKKRYLEKKKEPPDLNIAHHVEKCGEIEKLKRMLEEEREKVKDRENRIQRLLSVSSEISGDVSSKDDPGLFVAKQIVFPEGCTPPTLDWSQYGLKMHFLQNTISPSEVIVKALIGGEFQFPTGMELVSAVYVIKFAKELTQPVKLEIQHCVRLKSLQQLKYLSFITAPIDKSEPPYKFTFIEGGKFHTDSQYGMIIRSKFCLMAVGKKTNGGKQDTPSEDPSLEDNTLGSDSDETQITPGHDIQSTDNSISNTDDGEVIEPILHDVQETIQTVGDDINATTNGSSIINMSNTGAHKEEKNSGTEHTNIEDSGIPISDVSAHSSVSTEVGGEIDVVPDNDYNGTMYYEKIGNNKWKMKFIVVQNVDAFLEIIKTNEANINDDDITIQFTFVDPVNGYIQLDTDSNEEPPCQGWKIEPNQKPLKLRKRNADQFGVTKTKPPCCPVTTVWAQKSSNPAERLRHPVKLTGINSDTNIIYISRFLDIEKKNAVSDTGTPSHQPDFEAGTNVNTDEVIKLIKSVMVGYHTSLCSLWQDSVKTVADHLLEARIVTYDVQRNPTSDKILNSFFSGFAFLSELQQIEEYCVRFFNAFYAIGGPFIDAADKIKKAIIDRVGNKLRVQLSI